MGPLDWGRGDTRRLSTRDFPFAVLALVDEREGGRFCVACKAQGLVTPSDQQLQLDHKLPLSKGGDNHHSNLQWACESHNKGRGNRKRFPRKPKWARTRR